MIDFGARDAYDAEVATNFGERNIGGDAEWKAALAAPPLRTCDTLKEEGLEVEGTGSSEGLVVAWNCSTAPHTHTHMG